MPQAGIELAMYFGMSLKFRSFCFLHSSAMITSILPSHALCGVVVDQGIRVCTYSRVTLLMELYLKPLFPHSKSKKLKRREVWNLTRVIQLMELWCWASDTTLDELEVYNLNHYVFIMFRKLCGFRRSHTDISDCSKSASLLGKASDSMAKEFILRRWQHVEQDSSLIFILQPSLNHEDFRKRQDFVWSTLRRITETWVTP